MKKVNEEKIKNKRKNKIIFIVIMILSFVFLSNFIYGGIVYSLLDIEIKATDPVVIIFSASIAIIPLLIIVLVSLYNGERRAKEVEIKNKILQLNDFGKKGNNL